LVKLCSCQSVNLLLNHPAWYDKFSWRYDMLSYARQVALYRELRLPALWDTINSLRALTLDPPLEGTEEAGKPGFNDLRGVSLRRVFSLVPESMTAGWSAGEPLSLRKLRGAVGSPGMSLRQTLLLKP
jgi:hypothetical protein